MKHYAQRDPMALGQHYGNHVSAMTGEGLDLKSDIAAELAHRDAEIERRDARIAELEAQVDLLLAAAEDTPEAARIRELEDTNNALRAQLAAAQSLRLGRAPTVEDCEGSCPSAIVWSPAGMPPEFAMVIPIESVRKLAARGLVRDVIFLDSNGQPCPCGGWGGSR